MERLKRSGRCVREPMPQPRQRVKTKQFIVQQHTNFVLPPEGEVICEEDAAGAAEDVAWVDRVLGRLYVLPVDAASTSDYRTFEVWCGDCSTDIRVSEVLADGTLIDPKDEIEWEGVADV